MPFPFEVTFEEVERNLDEYVDTVFSCLQSTFLTLPKGPDFIDYPVFERGYEALKKTTEDFRDLSPEPMENVFRNLGRALGQKLTGRHNKNADALVGHAAIGFHGCFRRCANFPVNGAGGILSNFEIGTPGRDIRPFRRRKAENGAQNDKGDGYAVDNFENRLR